MSMIKLEEKHITVVIEYSNAVSIRFAKKFVDAVYDMIFSNIDFSDMSMNHEESKEEIGFYYKETYANIFFLEILYYMMSHINKSHKCIYMAII